MGVDSVSYLLGSSSLEFNQCLRPVLVAKLLEILFCSTDEMKMFKQKILFFF